MKRFAALVLAFVLMAGMAAASETKEAEEINREAASFSLGLFQKAVDTGEKNVVISPVSAYLALGLAAAGAKGETLQAFSEVLGADADALLKYCAGLSSELMHTRGSTDVRLANSGWIDEGFSVDPEYLARITGDMQAEVLVRDLDTEKTRREINGWVNEKTAGLIPMLLDRNLAKETVLALINTLYFKAKWRDPFEANDTFEREFFLADGSSVSVPFLNEWRCDRDYIHIDGVEGMLRPYDDGKTAFLALRPADGKSIKALMQSLDADAFTKYIASAKETYMTLSMPKFTLDYTITMNDMLIAMGLARAFDPNLAAFEGMGISPNGNIFLSRVMQKVRIEVNELGTEAAAATVVDIAAGCAMPVKEPVELIFDSPFLYAVVDLETGIPLFIGCLDDPAA